MKIAIYGAGALGAYYGARLAQAGHDVTFIARGAHLAAIRERGLKVHSPDGDVHLESPTATDDPRECGAVDLVVVAVKSWHIAEIAPLISPLLGPNTVVLPFLNGVEASDHLGEIIGREHVLGGLSKVFSLIEAPGVIRHFKPGAYVSFGELDGEKTERLEPVREAFASAGADTELSSDIRSDLWKKLLMVSSWAGLGALAKSPIGIMRSQPETRELIDRSMDEGIAVGAARGHNVTPAFKEELWTFYEQIPAEGTASMMRDIFDGKPSELDAWNGAIVRLGEALGVDTPVHRFTYHTLLPLERRARGLL